MHEVASFWVGDQLSAIEQASAISFLMQGHRLILYVMDEVRHVPPGVVVQDARSILPAEKILRHAKTGSPAIHADLFRYALMQKTRQVWVDLDLIALRPFDFAGEHIFGYESERQVNNAVLRLPADSPALQGLLKYQLDTRGYPEYFSASRRLKYFLKSLGRGVPIERWPWGATGPRALTHHLQQSGEISHALPAQAFYPVPFASASQLLEPHRIQEQQWAEDTYAVHLWGAAIRKELLQRSGGRIPKDSYLHRCVARAAQWAGIDIPQAV